MTLPLEVEKHNHVYYYYVSSVGSIVASIIILSMLINIIYHYIKLFHSTDKKSSNHGQAKTSYILFIVISIISLLICFIYAFIRGNIFNGFPVNKFSLWLCEFSYYSVFTLIMIYQILIFSLFIYRVQTVFKATVYEYASHLFVILYVLLIIGFGLCMVLVFYTYPANRFALYIFKGTDYLFCGATHQITDTVENFINTLIFVSLTVIFSAVTLYLFTKKLYTLQSELVEQYMTEIQEKMSKMDSNATNRSRPSTISSKPSSILTGTTSNTPNTCNEPEIVMITPVSPQSITEQNSASVMNDDDENDDNQHNEIKDEMKEEMKGNIRCNIPRTMTLEHIITESKKGDESAKRILGLHTLIKKHTILIYITITSIIGWLLTTFMLSSWVWIQIVWILLVNDICIWLMFATSRKYWKLCAQYLCCYLCFWNKQRTIQRNCLCFHC